jgi:hypothetical protein
MKKKYLLFYLCILTLASGFLITACKKKNYQKNVDFEKIENFEMICKEVGREHNEGLDYVYLKLKADPTLNNEIKVEEVYDLARKYTFNFLNQSKIDFIEKNLDRCLPAANVAFEWADDYSYSSRKLKSTKSDVLWSASVSDSLSEVQKKYLNVLKDAINDTTKGLAETIEVFESVRLKVKEECTIEEAYIIILAIEVGVNSLSYWYENLDKWILLANGKEKSNPPKHKPTPSKQVSKSFDWKQVGKVDVATGVGAAAGTGVAYLFGPVGWGVFGAATTGGAVAGSVTDVILQLW